MSTQFELKDVSYAYPGGQPGLKEMNLSISQGGQVAILGANASGKSTLLRLMDGLLFPTEGTVEAFGRELSEKMLDGTEFGRFFRHQVAYLFQNVDAQLFCHTVEEELSFGPRHMGIPKEQIEERIEDTLDMFHLREIRGRSPQSLSGGEKRRVGLASVLIVNPSVVMLDEPTLGLDPRNRAFLIDTIAALADAGKTIIAATHDLELAHEFAERTVVLSEDHQIAADGKTDDILGDIGLLTDVNLIHIHPHRHGHTIHAHPSRFNHSK